MEREEETAARSHFLGSRAEASREALREEGHLGEEAQDHLSKYQGRKAHTE